MRAPSRRRVTAIRLRSCMLATASEVNTKGKRFVPETWLQVPKAKAIAERTEDNRSFMLIGADADKNAQILTNTIKRFARLGFEVIKADTIEEAAKKGRRAGKNR